MRIVIPGRTKFATIRCNGMLNFLGIILVIRGEGELEVLKNILAT